MTGNAAIVFGVGPRQGIGAELCYRAAREGLHVFVNGRTEKNLDEIVSGIVAEGGSAEALPADVTSQAELTSAMTHVATSGRRLELAVYNAGNNRPESFLDVSPTVFEAMWRVICFGGFLVPGDCPTDAGTADRGRSTNIAVHRGQCQPAW